MAGSHTDITDRVATERENVLKEQRLARAEKLATLGTLVSGVGHEINNPAAIIMMNTPVLKELFSDILPILHDYCTEKGIDRIGKRSIERVETRIAGLLDGIAQGVERIRDIVQGLRTFAGADPTLQDQEVSIPHAIKSAVMLAGYQIRAASGSFSVSVEGEIPPIRGNLHRITQAIISLLLNAVESLSGHGKAISLSVRYEGERKTIVLAVCDEGCGIPDKDMPMVTDPFFTTKRDTGGRGLGLSIVERIVRDHGGNMEIRSEVDRGTVVTLEFPVPADPEAIR
jgi:polar amino acid transport system substrate-binding protein